METYATTCPHCGGALAVNVLGPEVPPWLCRLCRRSWWAAELTNEARDHYRPERHDFRPHKVVRDRVFKEAEVALQRGSSVRADQLRHVRPAALQRVAAGRLATDFAAAIAAHLKGT